MKKYRELRLSTALLGLILTVMVFIPALKAESENTSAKEDYITCWKQPCVYDEGIDWSRKHPNGVAVSVRMGIKPAVTDDQIKVVLTRDLTKHGVKNIKFYYEQNDAVASGITLHIRGGVEGVFTIANVREQLPAIARRALNDNPLFRDN